ncbi:intraflagellar transport protein 57 homolog [Corythoichthys intestinalis]|uniref:intraflagellar transport protein 57 homolog n=1 Tax=Corythoichthys intestinalis TaxID=161448 RepID=UPI0025A631A8|nr:intraflagellar transport protein 57 homolog [Corythoichthys intestinalis]XP_061794957.1 intraflagellar transport protein 57 homolog [Nerophis lumbriciformis]
MADDGRRGWEEDERGPGAAHHGFVLMAALMEKLKILNCDQELLEKHNMKPLSRHYFVSSPYLAANSGEQFYLFAITAAWLINAAGGSFGKPREDDEPTATVSNILAELRALGVKVDFPPSKLKSGSGEHVCFVLNTLAEHALKRRGFSFKRPNYPSESAEEESMMDEHAELALDNQDEAHLQEDDDEDEENLVDLEALTLQSHLKEAAMTSKPEEILRSTVDAAQWNLEVERVLPLLKVTVRTDNKDWRVHVDQMHQHQDGIKSSLHEAKGYLDKLEEDISRTLEKVSSREKYMNKQLEAVTAEHRVARAKLAEVRERYQEASGGVAQRTQILAELSEEFAKVKQEMEDRGSSMSDGAAVVKIKQSLSKLKQEIVRMDVRAGVVAHMLLQAKLKRKSNMSVEGQTFVWPDSQP